MKRGGALHIVVTPSLIIPMVEISPFQLTNHINIGK